MSNHQHRFENSKFPALDTEISSKLCQLRPPESSFESI